MADETDTPNADEHVSESTESEVDEAAEADEIQEDESQSADQPARRRKWIARRLLSDVRVALVAGAVVVATLAGLAGWRGYHAYEKHEAQVKRDLFVQIARQGAVNLTTIDYGQIEGDVQRILDSSTGRFRDDFAKRSQPFIEMVKAAQSKSEGTVTDAGLESERGDSAQVLVAVAVKSRTAAGQEAPREWRMRIEVQSVGDDAKVSNVVFVP
jgi:Mce-associated membrane protein